MTGPRLNDTERLLWLKANLADCKRQETAHELAGNAEMAQFFRDLARDIHATYDHSCRMARKAVA